MPKKIKLSFGKISDFLDKWNFSLVKVYITKENTICFLECATPKHQKSFLVHLPEKYVVPNTGIPSSVLKRWIFDFDERPTRKATEIIEEIRTSFIKKDDLVLLTNDRLDLFFSDGSSKSYCFTKKIQKTVENPHDTKISKIEEKTLQVLEKLDLPQQKIDVPEDDSEDEQMETETTLEENIKTEDTNSEDDVPQKIELVFQDEDGNPMDEVSAILDEKIPDDEILRESENIDEEDTTPYVTPKPRITISNIVEEIDDESNSIGIVYFVMNIKDFLSKIESVETLVQNKYDFIDDIERKKKREKFDHLKDLFQTFSSTSERKFEERIKREKDLKIQLVRLTNILDQIKTLQQKVKEQPRRYSNYTKDINNLYMSTRKEISELNNELLKHREETNKLLTEYFSMMKKLISIDNDSPSD